MVRKCIPIILLAMSLETIDKGLATISKRYGILKHVCKLPRLNGDPFIIGYGISNSDTTYLGGSSFMGHSSGCGYCWEDAILGTIGETVERYAAAFYNIKDTIYSSYRDLTEKAISPSEFALYHREQYGSDKFRVKEFTKDIKLHWVSVTDITSGEKVLIPGQFIYMPFTQDEEYITLSSSTGLGAHTDYYKALLCGLYEVIERDSFSITWFQKIIAPKIVISESIDSYIDRYFPTKYEWHLFDITYDLGVPTVMGFCFGECEFGPFVAVGASTRSTMGEALKKVIQEIGQAIPYFRYLNSKEDSVPDRFEDIIDFNQHSIFYTKNPDLVSEFDRWRYAKCSVEVDLDQEDQLSDQKKITSITKVFKDKGYNVLVKDLTTPDINSIGFYSLRVFVPQLIQLGGAYRYYFLGGDRLYNVPIEMGYTSNDFSSLNRAPHPFP